MPLRAEADELAAVGVGERDPRVGIKPKRVDGLDPVPLVLHAVLPFPLGAERELDPEERQRHDLRHLDPLAGGIPRPVDPDDADAIAPAVEEPLVEREGHPVGRPLVLEDLLHDLRGLHVLGRQAVEGHDGHRAG